MGNFATVESLAAQLGTAEQQIGASGQAMQKLQEQAQLVRQEMLQHQQTVRQLDWQINALENQIGQLERMLDSIQDTEDDSGSAEDLRSGIRAQISQLQSQENAMQNEKRQEERSIRQAAQQLQSLTDRLQAEKNRLVQMRSALARADEAYAGLIGRHNEAQQRFQQIAAHQNKGSSIQSAQNMAGVSQASRQGRSRVAQLQARVTQLLGDGVVPAAAAVATMAAGTGIAHAVRGHTAAVSAVSTVQELAGPAAVTPGTIPTAASLTRATEQLNTPVGFLRMRRRGKNLQQEAPPQPAAPSAWEQRRKAFQDRIVVDPSSLQPSDTPQRNPGGPDSGQRVRERGGYGRDDDGAFGTGQGGIPWAAPTPPQTPSSIPSNWKRIQGPHSLQDDVAAVNPNYKTGDLSDRMNCQRCVVAGEARRKGYDVVAKPALGQTKYRLDRNGEIERYWEWDPQDRLPFLFLPDGSVNPEGFAAVFKGAKPVSCAAASGMMSGRNVCRQMQAWGEGARAIVAVYWMGVARDPDGNIYYVDQQNGQYLYRSKKNDTLITDLDKIREMQILTAPSGGHVFKAEVIAGKVCCYDEQSGNTNSQEVMQYFQMARGQLTQVIRVDNLEFTDLVQKCCKPRE